METEPGLESLDTKTLANKVKLVAKNAIRNAIESEGALKRGGGKVKGLGDDEGGAADSGKQMGPEGPGAPQEKPDEIASKNELHESLHKAIAGLEPREQEYAKGFLAGEDGQAIAKRLGLSKSTITRVKENALAALKDALAEMGHKDEYCKQLEEKVRYAIAEMDYHARYAADASGHEHVGKGSPEGGQFTGGEGQSPDEMAGKLANKGKAAKAPSRDDMINFLMDNGKLEGDDDAIDAMSDQQIAQTFAKAKGISAPAATASPPAPVAAPRAAARPTAPQAPAKPAAATPPPPAKPSAGPQKSAPASRGEDVARKIESLAGAEAGYAHGGATMTAAYPVAKALAGVKFSGNISPESVATILDEHGIIGEQVGDDRRLRVAILNPKALRAVLDAAMSGTHDGLPVINSMNLRRAVQTIAPARG